MSHYKSRQSALEAIKKKIEGAQEEMEKKINKTLEDLTENVVAYNKSCCLTRLPWPSRKHTDNTLEEQIQALKEKASQPSWNPFALFSNGARSTLIQQLSQHEQDLETLKKDTINDVAEILTQGIHHLKQHRGTQSTQKLKGLLSEFQSITGLLPGNTEQNESSPERSALSLRK